MPKQNMLQHTAHLSRSGFDMSQSYAFTCAPGMLLPVYSDLLNVGEKVSLSTQFFARTQPLVTPAMVDVDFNLEWFFVPATMLLTCWGQIRNQTLDAVTSMITPNMLSGGLFPGVNMERISVQYSNLSSSSPFYVDPNTNVASFANSSLFDSNGKSLFRMLDALGFNPYGVFDNPGDMSVVTPHNPNVFPIRGLAYQCIYQWFYRNDDYEPLNVQTYNWDRFVSDVGNNNEFVSNNVISGLSPFVLRYVDFRKDYFTSIKPSPISSSVSMLGGFNALQILSNINNYLTTTRVVPTGSVPNGTNPGASATSGFTFTQNSLIGSTGTTSAGIQASANLRSIFAVEKLARITGRASKDYDSQTLAHFGFKVPHDVKHQATRLRSSHGMLHIGEVVGTADTYNGESGSALGELAGKGYVSINDKKKVEFTAPVDGVLMCVFHCVPRLRVQNAFDKQNSLTSRLDLYIPEFDKLGMQPLYNYEYNPSFGLSADFRGWQLRYDQYKRKFDRVSAVFADPVRNQGINQYSAWVAKYSPFYSQSTPAIPQAEGAITPLLLKCSPTCLNNIMVMPYQPAIQDPSTFQTNPASEFYTDPFICDFRANVYKVSTMSPSGEPDMISL
ncbi:MAG: major capsid protein [Microviridae sp.]|nr:MAG: major capsid protein [Microviridae sp.]